MASLDRTFGLMTMKIPVHCFLFCLFTFFIGGGIARGNPKITEFLAINESGMEDSDGDQSSWIEILNSGTKSIATDTFYLTDDPAQPKKWRLPKSTLAPGDYLVVFASGKNRTSGSEWHTNFTLKAEDGFLGLVAADGKTIVDQFADESYPAQKSDISYGKSANSDFGYLAEPSPGETNGTPYAGFLKRITFSTKRGFFEDPFELSLSSNEEGAEIRYTTNGDDPASASAKKYTGPISIEGTMIVRAAAVKPRFHTKTTTHTYFFLEDILDQAANGEAPEGWPRRPVNRQVFNYGMDPDVVGGIHTREEVAESLKSIPSISISLPLEDLIGAEKGIWVNATSHGRDWERAASLEILNPKDPANDLHSNAGLRIRGGYTRRPHFYKHGFRLFFRKEYGASKLRHPVFGAEGADTFDNLDLRTTANHSWARNAAGDSDPTKHTFVRDVFARDTQALMGQPYTRSRYYHLYINGVYWGIYQSQERPKAAYGETYFGGKKEDFDAVKTANWDGGYVTEATDGSMDAWNELWRNAVTMRNAPTDANYFKMMGRNAKGERDQSMPVLLDPTNLADYMIIIFYMGDGDAPLSAFLRYRKANNWHCLYHPTLTQGFKFFCHDGEHTMDVPTAVHNRTGPFVAGSQNQTYSNPEWIHQNLVGNAEYRLLFADRVHRHFFNGGVLTPEVTLANFQKRAKQVGPAMIAQSARWGDAQRSSPFTLQDWTAAISNVTTEFLPTRTEIVLAQLVEAGLYPEISAPKFSKHGGEIEKGTPITITSGVRNGTIFYTVDGSDPRLPGGAVNPKAKKGSPTIRGTMGETKTLNARNRLGDGTWSALASATFLVNQVGANAANLKISEIMYRPAKPSDSEADAGFKDRGDFEFIELQNTGSKEVILDDVAFTNGIEFEFAQSSMRTLEPGKFVLLVKNREAFETRYGAGLPIAGEYSGSLSNDGESLGIRGPKITSIAHFTYNDKEPWPEEADGDGKSLVLKDSNNGYAVENWAASADSGGSPGKQEP